MSWHSVRPLLAAAVAALCVASAASAGASGHRPAMRVAQVLEAETVGTDAPIGLAFSPRTGVFHVVAPPSPGAPTPRLFRLRPGAPEPSFAQPGAAPVAAAVGDPINVAIDDARGRLLVLSGLHEVVEVAAGSGGVLDGRTLVRHDVASLGLQDPQGLAVEPASGALLVLDAGGPRVVRVARSADGRLDAATVSEVDLRRAGVGSVRGLAVDPSTGHLHVGGDALYELTADGRLVAERNLSDLGIGTSQGMTFAPSGDRTDDPDTTSLYVADSGGPGQATGQVVELSTTATVEAQTAQFTSSLVNTIDTGAWSPPSPDPSGLAYLPATRRLMVVDGEVEETVNGITHFAGANVWETTLAGDVTRTTNISTVPPTETPMTDEPTGVAFDPATGRYFVTEDGRKRVYRLDPGGDALVGTADDTWDYFRVDGFGNTDPEGVAFDTLAGQVVVADGVNAEIYVYTPAGGLVGHFDVLAYGVEDPEAVEFNPATGTLFVLSNRRSGPIVIEVSTTGALLQTIDVSAAGARKPAGLAYAPASDGSGAMRFYIADRGVDNDKDPTAVDGKIFELTAPGGSTTNTAPTITSDGGGATAAKSVPENQTAVTDVDATDVDGDALTYSLASGADKAAFAIDPASGVLTFVSAPDFEAPTDTGADNVYDVTVAVSDGNGGSDSQAIAVTVTDVDEGGASPPPPTGAGQLQFSLRDNATVGGVSVANEDLARFDGTSVFDLSVDGSDVGLGKLRTDAAAWLDADTLLLSFSADGAVPGIASTVEDTDIVRFDATSLGTATAGSFSTYVDGSDLGLTESAHDVDGVEPLADGRILISTTGTAKLPGVTARDEDLLALTPTSLGDATAGAFELYFDGSDVGLGDSGEDVDGVAVDGSGHILLSTLGAFAVPGLSGADEDVFVFAPTALGATTSGTYSSTLYFDGSAHGLEANKVFAVELPLG